MTCVLPHRGVHSEARIAVEDGRHVVYLDVFLVEEQGRPAGVVSRRLSDYPTRAKAEVAARWFERAARRGDPPSPPGDAGVSG